MTQSTLDQIHKALEKVIDPEIRRPITELDMVADVRLSDDGQVCVVIALTTAACPLKDRISEDVRREVASVPMVTSVVVELTEMSAEQKQALRERLAGPQKEIQFNKPGSLTRIYAVTSGKGGVGKSSVTANLAAALAAEGLQVGVVDADIYGFSIPRMLGVEHTPTTVDGMIIPPVAQGVKVISIGMFVPPGQAVVWRGPMLHRALQQFLADVYWGDLDVLLLDLPPGTGDIAISVAQLLPGAEILVVTTPQIAAAEVAERAGSIASQTKQRVVGVIENMSYLPQDDGTKLELFGAGGGQFVCARLAAALGYEIPLLAQVPLDIELRQGSDKGVPAVLGAAAGPAGQALAQVAQSLAKRSRGLAGRRLSLQVEQS